MEFLGKWREKIAFGRVKKILQKSNRTKVFRNFSEIKSVLLLYSGTDTEGLTKAIKILQKENKYVVAWVYNPTELQYTQQKDINIHYFGKKMLGGFFYKPNSQIEESFSSRKYDVIIDLTSQDIISLHYLLAISQTNFKVGLKKDFNFAYDFMIEMQRDIPIAPTKLLEEIIFYLKAIGSR